MSNISGDDQVGMEKKKSDEEGAVKRAGGNDIKISIIIISREKRRRDEGKKGIENSYFISCLIYDMPLRIFLSHFACCVFAMMVSTENYSLVKSWGVRDGELGYRTERLSE